MLRVGYLCEGVSHEGEREGGGGTYATRLDRSPFRALQHRFFAGELGRGSAMAWRGRRTHDEEDLYIVTLVLVLPARKRDQLLSSHRRSGTHLMTPLNHPQSVKLPSTTKLLFSVFATFETISCSNDASG